jgi:hypothetical protein
MRYSSRRSLVTTVLGGVVGAILLGTSGVTGTTPTVPEISEETLVGIWESINPGWPEVIRMDIRKTGPSYLALAIRASDPPEAAVFQVKELRVRRGKVDVRADDLTKDSNYSLVVHATGRAGGGWGVLEGKTVLQDRKTGRSLRQLSGPFVLSEKGYIQELGRLSEAAEKRIQVIDRIQASGK